MNLTFAFRPLAAGLTLVIALALASPAAAGTIVHFDTNLGAFDVELYDGVAPTTVNNFLSYVTGGSYDNTIVHRSVANFVVQGGGFQMPDWSPIPNNGPIPLEYTLPNTRGTIAMARTAAPNTATTQWFINTVDNSTTLAPGGSSADGYAVFGHVLGSGMDVVDAIANVPVYNGSSLGSAFSQVPLINYVSGSPYANSVIINSVSVVPEPSSLALGLAGLVGLGMTWRSRRKKVRAAGN